MAGGAEKRWRLPEAWDGAGVRALSDDAKAWAASEGATHGQEKAVHKTLTEAGYYSTSSRRIYGRNADAFADQVLAMVREAAREPNPPTGG